MTQSSRIPYPHFFSYVGYTIFSVFLAAAILELGATILRSAYHWARPADTQSPANSPPYHGYPWAQEFWNEEYVRRTSSTAHHYVPFLLWGERPWHSNYINVDESAIGNLRRTVNPTNPACAQHKVIWMFGGSTLLGNGVPDMETIPSHLSRELNAVGPGCFAVLNLGMEGYLTNQELILLVEALKTGQRPDILKAVNEEAAQRYRAAHFPWATFRCCAGACLHRPSHASRAARKPNRCACNRPIDERPSAQLAQNETRRLARPVTFCFRAFSVRRFFRIYVEFSLAFPFHLSPPLFQPLEPQQLSVFRASLV
jgi:hypothetical protein